MQPVLAPGTPGGYNNKQGRTRIVCTGDFCEACFSRRAVRGVCVCDLPVFASAVAAVCALGGAVPQGALQFGHRPGHGGMDVGTVAADGTAEKEINLAIARDLYAFAVITGIPASMTRTGDYLVYKSGDNKKRSDLYNRFDYINSIDNAVLVSIHQNHFADTSQWGMQIWYTVNDPLSKALAAHILAYDKQHLQPGNRRENKPSDDSYYLLYKAKVPSVMVECGFMSNVKENNQLKQDVYRRRVAFCILAGLSDTMKTGELP